MRRRLVLLAWVGLLAACGGGGGGGVSADGGDGAAGDGGAGAAGVIARGADGIWEGPQDADHTLALVILEDGQIWGLHTGYSRPSGMLFGRSEWAQGAIKGQVADLFVGGPPPGEPQDFGGTYVPRQSLGVGTEGRIAFNATFASAYDQPASLEALAGTFTGHAGTRAKTQPGMAATISPAGVVSIALASGCSATGSVTPHASGRNVFDIRLTFSGGACLLGHGNVVQGVSYYMAADRRLVLLGRDATKTDGFMYLATK